MSLRFRCSRGTVEFSDAVLRTFHDNRQLSFWSRESGGQLFFRYAEDNIILVVLATGPGAGDKRSRYSFWPNRKREQLEIESAFNAGLHYIGDWHSHPEDIPSPSSDDETKMHGIFIRSEHQLENMLFVIVGRNTCQNGLWVGFIDHNRTIELTVVADEFAGDRGDI